MEGETLPHGPINGAPAAARASNYPVDLTLLWFARLDLRMILLTRKAEFSAAHFYFNPAWSEEENDRIFGKCANRQGHGHNYTLEVTVAGEPDPVSGFVVDLKRLKDILESEVLSVYDHRHLNFEVPEFATTVPTTENIAVAIWRRLDGKIPNAKLHRVRVYEVPELFADFYGEGA